MLGVLDSGQQIPVRLFAMYLDRQPSVIVILLVKATTCIRKQKEVTHMAINVGNGVMLYTPPDAARMLDMPVSTLNYWAKEKIVAPSVAGSRGKGYSRYYSLQDLVALKVVIQLRKRGISFQALRHVVEHLRKKDNSTSPLVDSRLMLVGDDVADYDENLIVSLLRTPGQGILRDIVVVDVGEVVKKLKDNGEQAAA
jgi:DNA-binding transcriptional MerR regulator